MTTARHLARWLPPVLWVALTIAVGFALSRMPLDRTLEGLARASPAWIVSALVLNLLILPLWAGEWTLLARPARVAYSRMFEIVALTASVLNSVPMLAGEASAVALLIARADRSRGAALSVLAMDQLLVAFAKVGVLASAAALSPLPTWIRGGLLSLGIVFGVFAALLVVIAHRWERIAGRLDGSHSRVRSFATRALAWGSHLAVLRHPSRAGAVAGLAIAKKALEIGAVVAVQVALGMPPSVTMAVVVVGALAISTLVPLAPANLGVYEATVFAVYRFFNVAPELALGLALVQHVCFLLPALATGYLILTVRQLVPRWRRAA